MWEAALFMLLVAAVALGWLLGRHGLGFLPASLAKSRVSNAGLYRGLDFLLHDRPDEAIEAFIQSLEVNRETFELHLSLGNLLRRRGEVDRAIRIHNNLLARPTLQSGYRHRVQLELARDYVSAGLLDRAEQQLLELADAAAELRCSCLQLLVEIYQSERDWAKAVDAVHWLLDSDLSAAPPGFAASLPVMLAQFHCELAEAALRRSQHGEAREHIRQALRAERSCARASLLQARMLLERKQPRRAIRALRRIELQQQDMLPEAVALLAQAFEQLNDRSGFHTLLRQWVEKYPRSTLVLAMAAEIEREQGEQAAAALLSEQLRQRPSLRGLKQLIEYQAHQHQGDAENLELLRTLIGNLVDAKPAYRCNSCGFAGHQLHWLCPGCKTWGSVRPIHGIEGE